MQFTSSLVSLLLAAVTTSVQALPGSPVEQRQETARIHVRYWSDSACGATPGSFLVEDDVWIQDPVGRCIDVNVWREFGSTEIVTNLATHTARAYRLDDCAETGENANYFDVLAGSTVPRCFSQQRVDSVKFLEHIISMSWTIAWPQGSLSTIFCEALDYALENNVLMFCSSRDSGHESGTRIHYLPAGHKRDSVIKIGAAQPSGLPYEWAGPLGNLDFILPGVEVVQRNTCRSPSDVKYMEKETGSSVATALGAGLAALIIYCARINKMFGSGPSGARLRDEDIKKLQDAPFMVHSIQQFGLSKNKLVEVWIKLDDKNKKLVGVPLTKQQDIVAQLARDLISPSAT